jgi:hypothetical protein
MLLPKLYWRRFRCADCGQLFELPLDDTTLPTHRRRWDGNEACRGDDAIPA